MSATAPRSRFTARSAPELPAPDLFCMALLARFNGYSPGYSQAVAAHHDALSWAILKAHTGNRAGRVTLRSADPRDPPAIDFHYFEEGGDADLAAMVAGGEAASARCCDRCRARPGRAEESPGPEVRSDAEIAQWVRDTAWGHHACGTAAIGPQRAAACWTAGCACTARAGCASSTPRSSRAFPGFFIAGAIYLAAEKAADLVHKDAMADFAPAAPP